MLNPCYQLPLSLRGCQHVCKQNKTKPNCSSSGCCFWLLPGSGNLVPGAASCACTPLPSPSGSLSLLRGAEPMLLAPGVSPACLHPGVGSWWEASAARELGQHLVLSVALGWRLQLFVFVCLFVWSCVQHFDRLWINQPWDRMQRWGGIFRTQNPSRSGCTHECGVYRFLTECDPKSQKTGEGTVTLGGLRLEGLCRQPVTPMWAAVYSVCPLRNRAGHGPAANRCAHWPAGNNTPHCIHFRSLIPKVLPDLKHCGRILVVATL